MSLQATEWALRQRTNHPSLKLVLVLLSDCESGDWRAIFNIEKVAGQAEMSVDQVKTALKRLEALRLVSPSLEQRHPATGKDLAYPFYAYDMGAQS